MTPKDEEKNREIPISLRGIESILLALQHKLKKPASIRQISELSNLSMRVTKNILLQLEILRQVERVVDKGQILPKWQLTRLGRNIVSAMETGSDQKPVIQPFLGISERLLKNISNPKSIEELNAKIGATHHNGLNLLNGIRLSLSKSMGICYDRDRTQYAECLGNIIKTLMNLKTNFSTLRSNPNAYYSLQKKGRKPISARAKKEFLAEILFINQIILNQLNFILELQIEVSRHLEYENYSIVREFLYDFIDQTRLLTYLLQKRRTVDDGIHIFTDIEIKSLLKNNFSKALLEKITPRFENDDESKILHFAMQVKSFTLADILSEFKWDQSKLTKIAELLESMTKTGILQHSKTHLQGEKWFIVM